MRPCLLRRLRLLVLVAACVLQPACGAAADPSRTASIEASAQAAHPSVDPGGAPRWVPEVVDRIPHDPEAWTQGLEIDDGVVYESTGLYGQSTIRELDRRTGAVQRDAALDPSLFGEGMTVVGDRILQLTWREETLLVRDRATLAESERIGYAGEGWGLCLDGDGLVMSDGSATLSFRQPESFEEMGTVTVTRDGSPIGGLNELECVDGLVFANVRPTSEIAVIEPSSGEVVATIDASSLEAELADQPALDVLNGIAHDPETGTFLLTGKRWPVIFEVRFVPAS